MGDSGHELLLRAHHVDVRGDIGEDHHGARALSAVIDHLTCGGGEHARLALRLAHGHERVGERLLQHGAAHRALLGRHRQSRPGMPQEQLGLVRIVVARRGGELMDSSLGAIHQHIVAITIHHHDPHVHGVDHVLQQPLRRGCGFEQRLLLRKRLGELLVPTVHHRQRAQVRTAGHLPGRFETAPPARHRSGRVVLSGPGRWSAAPSPIHWPHPTPRWPSRLRPAAHRGCAPRPHPRRCPGARPR